MPKQERAALYIRLSKEDENEKESQSVGNQRSMLLTFAEQRKFSVYDSYIDDGFSGTNFDRPAFQRMLCDIEQKRVNLVITKDLSRLGRDYIQTGYYMERYFPEHGVRFLSLLDGIDTGIESSLNDITPFRAILNDLYARDISKKISSVKRDKQKKGLFIGGKASYGYKLSETEKNTIVPDEKAAQVIRRIFRLALEGESCRGIAGTLNAERIPPPAVYAGLKTANPGPYTGKWSAERISAILQNPVYIGTMVQGKRRKLSYKSKKVLHVPKEQWVAVEHTHSPLIDTDVFDRVQQLLQSRRHVRSRTYEYPLKGMLFCQGCGSPMAAMRRTLAGETEVFYLVCRTYQRFPREQVCTSHSIRADLVARAVEQQLISLCKLCLQEPSLRQAALRIYERQGKRREPEEKILSQRLECCSNALCRMYEDRLSGLLEEPEFMRLYFQKKQERTALQDQLFCIQEKENLPRFSAEQQVEVWEGRFLETLLQNREALLQLIKRVEITADHRVRILCHFSIGDEMREESAENSVQ